MSIAGELIRSDKIVEVGTIMCGDCRGTLRIPDGKLADGQEIQCPLCHTQMWFSVRPNADIKYTCNRGFRPQS